MQYKNDDETIVVETPLLERLTNGKVTGYEPDFSENPSLVEGANHNTIEIDTETMTAYIICRFPKEKINSALNKVKGKYKLKFSKEVKKEIKDIVIKTEKRVEELHNNEVTQ